MGLEQGTSVVPAAKRGLRDVGSGETEPLKVGLRAAGELVVVAFDIAALARAGTEVGAAGDHGRENRIETVRGGVGIHGDDCHDGLLPTSPEHLRCSMVMTIRRAAEAECVRHHKNADFIELS